MALEVEKGIEIIAKVAKTAAKAIYIPSKHIHLR